MCVFEPWLGQFVPTPRSSRQPRDTLSVLIYVISVALVAATTIVGFGIASFSFLYISKELPSSGIRDWGVEVKPVLSGVVPYVHANAARAPAATTLPSPGVEAARRASPSEDATAYIMQPPDVSGLQPSSEQRWFGTSTVSATKEVSRGGTMPTLPIPASQREQVFREFEMLLSNYAGFRSSRVRKECGPIKDPALRSDCLGSFSAYEPMR
jgi:hypothetical protein